jgi:hypothetical protein
MNEVGGTHSHFRAPKCDDDEQNYQSKNFITQNIAKDKVHLIFRTITCMSLGGSG